MIGKRNRAIVIALAVLMLIMALSPSAAVWAADVPARWEIRMIRSDLAARTGMNGQGVRVAVIDSGIVPLHCLAGLSPGADYTGAGTTEDPFGHGTFIAGVLAAKDATSSYHGVAPEAELVPFRCFGEGQGNLESVISAIYDAVDAFGCDVLNMSFGQPADDPRLAEAVAYALSRGVTVVAAAGNSGSGTLYYPAAYEGVIAVNAVDRTGTVASAAQKNASVALSAPGVAITGLTGDGGYETRTGSSFAVPFVSGAAAVLLSADETLTPAEIREILCQTALDRGEPGWDSSYGWGILDVEAALRAVLDGKACWLSAAEAVPDGVAVTAYNPGGEPLEGVCRFGRQSAGLRLGPDEAVRILFMPEPDPAVCAVWAANENGEERCVSNVRNWEGHTPSFTDVPESEWYYEPVTAAACAGLMLGMSDGTFDPEGLVTRGAFITTLHRFFGSAVPANASPFTDVPPDAWYAAAVDWGAENGLVAGISETEFGPGVPLTREEMATIIWRSGAADGVERKPVGASAYADAGTVAAEAFAGMDYCVRTGVIEGVSATELMPKGVLTRAQLATILIRLLRMTNETEQRNATEEGETAFL